MRATLATKYKPNRGKSKHKSQPKQLPSAAED